MKWIGWWILSFVLWLMIAAVEGHCKTRAGTNRAKAVRDAASTVRVGWFITGIVMLGIWCITR